MTEPTKQRSHSYDQFLKSCSLCKRQLVPGRDIYMYRGDRGFCSLECRQRQIFHDEMKETCALASKKGASSSPSVSASAQAPSNGETAVVTL